MGRGLGSHPVFSARLNLCDGTYTGQDLWCRVRRGECGYRVGRELKASWMDRHRRARAPVHPGRGHLHCVRQPRYRRAGTVGHGYPGHRAAVRPDGAAHVDPQPGPVPPGLREAPGYHPARGRRKGPGLIQRRGWTGAKGRPRASATTTSSRRWRVARPGRS